MDLQPLTSERLPTVPKLDKKQFISSYVQGQNMHAKSYAEEGRVVSSSWNVQHLTPEKQSPAVSNYPQNVGFSTPILTARMARLKKELERPEIENDMPNKTEAKKSSRVPNKETQAKPKPSDNPPAKSQKPLPKKRAADLHSDEDQAARLSERRRRKRIKRAIVQPEKGSDHDIASSSGDNKTKKRTRAKGNKPKIPAGLALMHGFTATNVGKNRLTASIHISLLCIDLNRGVVETPIQRRSVQERQGVDQHQDETKRKNNKERCVRYRSLLPQILLIHAQAAQPDTFQSSNSSTTLKKPPKWLLNHLLSTVTRHQHRLKKIPSQSKVEASTSPVKQKLATSYQNLLNRRQRSRRFRLLKHKRDCV
ncbi:hypothetical protein B0H10DRAFT_1803901 [Mycena sp. CBHHK59/15]|nr:hypothetical protein B0H10DRAFT_1803901 [Mycena sp. CBHHK59/15]